MNSYKKLSFKTMSREEILEKLYKNEDVIISLKRGVVYHYDEETSAAQRARMVQGIVLAVDKNFIHLGASEDELTLSVELADVSVIFKNRPIDESLTSELRRDGDPEH